MSARITRMDWDLEALSDLVAPAVDAETERIAAAARASAPVDTGDYKDGILTESQRWSSGRRVGFVTGTDHKTMIIESRTGNLARALES